jgi:hypothetical protein
MARTQITAWGNPDDRVMLEELANAENTTQSKWLLRRIRDEHKELKEKLQQSTSITQENGG